MNILITAASRRVFLTRLFREALRPVGGKVIAVDYESHSPALFFADKRYKVPLVSDPNYISLVREICVKENVKLVIPTIDPELILWAKAKEEMKKSGIQVSISNEETIGTFTDKLNTYRAFKKENIPFPHTFIPNAGRKPETYPLFVKPRKGRGSVGAFAVRNEKEFLFFSEYVKDPVMQTYLDGKEFTVDAFFDRDGQLIRCVPRWRLVIRSGVSDRGITFSNPALTELIQKIGRAFRFEGAINVQGKIFGEQISFFEINPRFSGGIQLSAVSGISFSQLLVQEMQGEKLFPSLSDYRVGMLMSSYEDSLFINETNRLLNPPD